LAGAGVEAGNLGQWRVANQSKQCRGTHVFSLWDVGQVCAFSDSTVV
jgi:hypothetical protein